MTLTGLIFLGIRPSVTHRDSSVSLHAWGCVGSGADMEDAAADLWRAIKRRQHGLYCAGLVVWSDEMGEA